LPSSESFTRTRGTVRPHHDRSRLEKSPLSIDGERSPVLSRSATVWHITESIYHERVLTLQHFGRRGAVGAKGHWCNSIDAIFVRPPPPPQKETAHRANRSPSHPAPNEVNHISAFSHACHFPRQRLRKSAKHHVRHSKG